MKSNVLIIEDEKRLRRILSLVLEDAGHRVQSAAHGGEGIRILSQWPVDVIVTDLKMKPVDGLEVLSYRNRNNLHAPVIIMTAFGTVETAVNAMKDNAFDYLTKPVDNRQLLEVVERAIRATSGNKERDFRLIGNSTAMKKLREEIALFSSGENSVLITGASGTGKELVARQIHRSSPWNEGPFIKVNCAAIPNDLLESELFGHRKGAFTGATEHYQGAFVRASGGVLFLDEIGDLPVTLQPKLLGAVEDKRITALGDTREQNIDIKIVSATNRDLEQLLAEKLFREDLYYRLNTVKIHLPTICERKDDVILLVDYFLDKLCRNSGYAVPNVDDSTLSFLRRWHWPGNVRELRNILERAVLICGEEDILLPQHLPEYITRDLEEEGGKKLPSTLDLRSQEKNLIVQALEKCNWNQSQAARSLGISRNTLRYRLKKHNLSKSLQP